VLEHHLEVYQRAYQRLSRARQWSDGLPQAISVAEVFAYCDGIGLRSPQLREDLLDLVQAMDTEFTNHVIGERNKDVAKSAGSDVVSP
jgi:hypothetical protein